LRKINIIGDKGYKLNNDIIKKLDDLKVKIHVLERKNKKIKISTITKKYLRNRYKIENIFTHSQKI